jgi:hypothetical protein
MTRSLKSLTLGALAVAGALSAGLAQAGGNTYWSVQVSAPGYPVGVGAVFSNLPGVPVYPPVAYVPPPVRYVPPPVVYTPPPVVYVPRPVIYAPAPVYAVPRPVVYGPPAYRVHPRHWQRQHRHRHGVGHGD